MKTTDGGIIWCCAIAIAMLTGMNTSPARAQTEDSSLPHVVKKDGRFALIVGGAPYLILGAQTNNSSAWPAVLPKVWPAMEFLHANTIEIPVYWEQFEPEQGKFDTTNIDTIITQAREHHLRVIFLWFATWKNGSNHYTPQWMKLQPEKYFNMMDKDGKYVDSPSPFATETLAADAKAFTAFTTHLKEFDPQHTVIMVQVENEPGSWQCTRDYSPTAQKIFDGPVPDAAMKAMSKPTQPNSNWSEVFGNDADEFFQVWFVARYIEQVAAAGKAVYPLPMYVNGSVRDPITPPSHYEVGGPNDNVFELWKAAAPSIDILSPDIYQRDTARYLKLLELYARPDNPLFVPETIGQGAGTRFLFSALGRGAIGYSPFGLDYTRLGNSPTGASPTPEEMFGATAMNYELLGPMSREIARLNFEGKIQTAVEMDTPRSEPATRPSPSQPANVLHFDNWDINVHFGTFRRTTPNERPTDAQPTGRILVAQLADNQFLIVGLYTRVDFQPTGKLAGKPWQYLIVEEGHYENDQFQRDRILNGDQTDWGLALTTAPVALRVSLYSR
jgi:Domain of unknown function (DUF5597)/Glycosyl hydrolases family 35